MRNVLKAFVLVIAITGLSCQQKGHEMSRKPDKTDAYLTQYAPYEMKFDASGYSEKDKTLLKNLVQAAQILDTIYWLQTSQYGLRLRDSLSKVQNDPNAERLLRLLVRNAGPFEQLNEYATFVGDQSYYPGDELYPRGMTVEQFDAYYETLPEDQKKQFMSPYTVIKQNANGGYYAVPYNVEYRPYLLSISKLLSESSNLTENASFAKFLRLKADALLTDNCFAADAAWIDMEGSRFDIVFGPFETYSDHIKGVKAKYEASIEVVDQEESKKLEIYKRYLKDMEENLPIPREYKSDVKGLTAKFVIVRDIYRAGEAAAGYQAVATNLPNDPEVHAKKGTKKTFWKNMFVARFNTIIKPVSMRLIDSIQQQYLSDEGFFQLVLMHEICHAVGPRTIKVGPKKGIAANVAIGPNYNPLEEVKADIAGLHSLAMLMDKGIVDKSREREFYVSFLGSLFRSIRFGLNEAHGKAAAISLNYMMAHGGIQYDHQTARWKIDFSMIRDGVKNLARELLLLEGNGDTVKVQEFIDQWTGMTPELQQSLDIVKDIAIDVMPKYSITW